VLKAIRVNDRVYRVMRDNARIACIVKVPDGWRVNTFIAGMRGSRTISATPYEAVRKYFRTAIAFPGRGSRIVRFRSHPFYLTTEQVAARLLRQAQRMSEEEKKKLREILDREFKK
jgi:hypothetical protein